MAKLWPPPENPSLNAGPIYTKLTRDSGVLFPATRKIQKIGYPRSDADAAAIEATLASVRPELVELENAAALPECRFERVASHDVILPEYNPMRNGIELFAARARRQAYLRDPMAAMRSLTIAARISAQTGGEPLLAAKGVQAATQSDILRTAEEVLADYGKRPDVRGAARRMFAALGPPVDFRDGLKGEWAWHWEVVRAYEEGKLGLDDMMKIIGFDASKVRFSKERTAFGIAMASPAGRARLSLNSAKAFLRYYEAFPTDPTQVDQARAARTELEQVHVADPDGMMLARIESPFLPLLADGAGRAIAERRLFIALLNALDAPVPPKSLPLAGKVAIDPFSGKRYRYEATSQRIRIWSVGPDGKDEGGKPEKGFESRDIAAVWPYPKAPGTP
ncbi:hypothetical protein EON79_09010 [bacterium]|nr:MAG: hypothetical protein EON79_09010 [bacterium]